jgi:phenylacetate-CoA ligase
VTSLVRQTMPVIHLRTGDHLEWSESAPCPCGSNSPKFILHGRMDSQINIWSSRLQLGEVETALTEAGLKSPVYQIEIREQRAGTLTEILQLSIEAEEATSKMSAEKLARALHRASKDVQNTHDVEVIIPRVELKWLKPGSLERISRTGKIRKVVDKRQL